MEIVIDGYKIHYKVSGNGTKTATILQGWGTEMSLYDSVADCINSEYRVIQLDFPGFGNSDEPQCAWDVEDYAQFMIKFFKILKIEETSLIGHSYGGRVIIRLAAKEDLPFTISNIVLVDAAGILPKKSFMQKLKIRGYKFVKKLVSINFFYKLCPDVIDQWRNSQGSEDYRNATPIMRQCLVKAVNEDLTSLLPQIKEDTLLVWGDLDTATPLADGQLMEKLIPSSGLAVIHGAGHFCFVEKPDLFRRILQSYYKIGE